jgi:hypothetical protein
MVVSAEATPRSAIIWTRSRELELEDQVPPDAEHDDLMVKVPPHEKILCRRRFDHPGRYAGVPAFSSICTRTPLSARPARVTKLVSCSSCEFMIAREELTKPDSFFFGDVLFHGSSI